ncbi:MAG: PAS domain S-box protein, partial [Flavobacteriales bacterium]|nr:PAS domain S-box protein [Flavobacteriales bacterium]
MDQLFGDNIFKLLFDNAAEGLIIVNREGDIVLNNPRAEEMFGYAEGELRQKPLSSLLPDHMGSKHSEYTNAYFTKPSKRMMGAGRDLQGKKKSGTLIPVEISLNHFAFEGETYAMALMTDITERKKSEGELNDLRKALEDQVVTKSKALEESQMLYREVARNFPNGTINVLDKNLNYVFAEGKELYKFGITSEKLVGTSYIGGLPSSVASDIEERLREVLAGNNQSFEITLDRGDYLVNSVALSSEEGISRILVVEQDITKQKRAEKEMKKALE